MRCELYLAHPHLRPVEALTRLFMVDTVKAIHAIHEFEFPKQV